jgi:hypothetical protein
MASLIDDNYRINANTLPTAVIMKLGTQEVLPLETAL